MFWKIRDQLRFWCCLLLFFNFDFPYFLCRGWQTKLHFIVPIREIIFPAWLELENCFLFQNIKQYYPFYNLLWFIFYYQTVQSNSNFYSSFSKLKVFLTLWGQGNSGCLRLKPHKNIFFYKCCTREVITGFDNHTGVHR